MANGVDETLEKKEALLESVQRNEQELRAAVDELTFVAQRQFHLGERIAQHPWGWLAGGFVVGLWLSRH